MASKDKTVIFRASEQAIEAYRETAKKAGLKVSPWIRKVLADHIRAVKK